MAFFGSRFFSAKHWAAKFWARAGGTPPTIPPALPWFTLVVPAESRTVGVMAEPRTLAVPAESRRVGVSTG